jgi:hypothetical protein
MHGAPVYGTGYQDESNSAERAFGRGDMKSCSSIIMVTEGAENRTEC